MLFVTGQILEYHAKGSGSGKVHKRIEQIEVIKDDIWKRLVKSK